MPLNKIKTCVYSCALLGFATTASAQMAGHPYHSGTPQTSGSMHHPAMYKPVPTKLTPSYTVNLNKTQVLHLQQKASAIVVGNPAIADVSVHSDKTIFVIGRGYGETNVMALDINGDVVLDANVQVVNVLPSNGVRVYNGTSGSRNTYNCTPYCNPAPVLGDEGTFIASNQGTSVQISNQIANSTTSASNENNFNSFGASLTQDSDPVIGDPSSMIGASQSR